MQFDPERLAAALAAVPEDAWSLPSTYAETRVHHGYRRVVLVSAGHFTEHAHLFRFVFDALDPIHDAWLSWIAPGGFIVPHRDAGPWRERWQVPASPAGEFHMSETFTPATGVAFQVEHWKEHAVTNDTDHPRVHVVIDRAIWLDRSPEPFTTYPVPAHVAGMVRRSLDATAAT